MAALAVHVPAEDWGNGGIVNWIKDEMNSHPEYIPSFLELLRVLPEVYQNLLFSREINITYYLVWQFADEYLHLVCKNILY